MKKDMWVAILVIVAFVAAGLACANGGTEGYQVTYQVRGTCSNVTITYNNAYGDAEQLSNVDVPWKKIIDVERGHFAYISAQNQGKFGTVETMILVDGDLFRESKSSGVFVIATSSGIVGR